MGGTQLRYGRAVSMFVLAYLVITVLAVALALALEAAMNAPPTQAMVFSPSYVLSEKFYPLLNLLVWTTFAWVYFKPRSDDSGRLREALHLGAFWLGLALVVDYVAFVYFKHPYSLSAHDFYVGQFPWIYLIYVALFASPAVYVLLGSKSYRQKA
jgi:hypothetical protein